MFLLVDLARAMRQHVAPATLSCWLELEDQHAELLFAKASRAWTRLLHDLLFPQFTALALTKPLQMTTSDFRKMPLVLLPVGRSRRH